MEDDCSAQQSNILKDSRDINPKFIISRIKIAQPLHVIGVNQVEWIRRLSIRKTTAGLHLNIGF
jgi:hypothetical protein